MDDVDEHPDKVFQNKKRFFLGPACIKKINGINISILCNIHGENFELHVTHEIKAIQTEDRILVASISADGGGPSLYVAFKYLKEGLHTTADTKNLLESLKYIKPINLDDRIEMPKKSANICNS